MKFRFRERKGEAEKIPRVLYLTRTGMLEPLGQSQVMSYIKGLSKKYRISLISFEKADDVADTKLWKSMEEECKRHDIRWLPKRFYYRPKILAPIWSMLVFFFLCLREVRKGNADLIHARSYIPAAVALLIYKLTRTPFIFDMRALWPEELITAGRLKRGSLMHKAIVAVERSCLKNAAAVVSLTHSALGYLREQYPDELSVQKLVVIPTCADLERFVPDDTADKKVSVYSCVGTVLSGWFHLDWLSSFFEAVLEHDPAARFEVITRDDADEVRKQLAGSDRLQSQLSIFKLSSDEVPASLQRHSASAMFFTQGLSKLGSSPTRMGEILGCGIPVIANDGVGDVVRVIEEYNAGVVVSDGSIDSMRTAVEQLSVLRTDQDLASRCRAAAEAVFSLDSGCKEYDQLYNRVHIRASK